jgi:hypothetical protein
MGSAASISKSIKDFSPSDIADYIATLGEAYVQYKDIIISNGVSGDVLAEMTTEDEIKSCLQDLQITNAFHQKKLISYLLKLLKAPSETATIKELNPTGSVNTINSNLNNIQWSEPQIEISDCITQTPRVIMSKLFEIQGIKVDPSDLDPAISKIKSVVGQGFGDGINRYDCFINYRVASDADLAEKLYLFLKSSGIHAYLDKYCLVDGMKWKEGFLKGLRNSRCFIALISSAGLAKVRDYYQDHTYDNVLLEYETALKVDFCFF